MKRKLIISAIASGVVASSLIVYGLSNTSNKYTAKAYAETQQSAEEIVIPNTEEEKAKLQNLMLNSIDYYKNAQGSLEYLSTSGNFHMVIDYQTDLSESPKSFEKAQVIPMDAAAVLDRLKDSTKSETNIYDGETLESVISDKKDKVDKVNKLKVNKVSKSEREELKNSTMKNRAIKIDGENVYIHRIDPSYMGIAKISLFPEDIAMGFLEDTTKWEIAGTESIAGVETIVIKGTLGESYSERYNAKNFKLNVSSNTGILLQMEVTDFNGVIKERVKTLSIKINEELNPNLFTIRE